MTHQQYLEIFRIIDESLWEDICKRSDDGWLKPFDKRIDAMLENCERAKKILSEYIDRSSERMRAMITSEAFRQFPAPTASSLPRMQASPIPSLFATIDALAVDEVPKAVYEQKM